MHDFDIFSQGKGEVTEACSHDKVKLYRLLVHSLANWDVDNYLDPTIAVNPEKAYWIGGEKINIYIHTELI